MINALIVVLTAPVTVTLYMRLGGHQSRSGRCGEETYVLHMPGIEPRLISIPAHSLIAISIQLSQLPFLTWSKGKVKGKVIPVTGRGCP
jgi:hypothetical protein